jgi:hypothetical protein
MTKFSEYQSSSQSKSKDKFSQKYYAIISKKRISRKYLVFRNLETFNEE